MTADEALTTAQRVGIRLLAEGDQLRYRAPKGALTAELRRALAEHKSTLLCALQELQGERLAITEVDGVNPTMTLADARQSLIVGDMCPRCREDGRIAHLYVRREGILWCKRCLQKGAPFG